MKLLFNMSTDPWDLARYADREDFLAMLQGFDGVELMFLGEDAKGIVPKEKVVGYHMVCPYCWLDFFRGDRTALLREFDDDETVRRVFGGLTPDVLADHYRRELERAKTYGAEYIVFHVSNAGMAETLSGRYRHSDREVIDGSCELLNLIFPADGDHPQLMLENLWEPGLRMTDPEMTARLLEGVKTPNKGIMLDTGHLMHTEPALKNQREAVAYIHE
ncbi:MAG: sugar phosphate isomerase/epimerase, partial [Clostridia bacterium]|nr:sugar phosphate isomerase/epimerase [Clostridia bacterium]